MMLPNKTPKRRSPFFCKDYLGQVNDSRTQNLIIKKRIIIDGASL